MNNQALSIFKWTFLLVGLGMFAGAWFLSDEGLEPVLILSGMGLVFFCIGASFIFRAWMRAYEIAGIRKKGMRVEAELIRLDEHQSIRVNGHYPHRAVLRWEDPADGYERYFRSDDIWLDSADKLKGRRIPVYIHMEQPEKYYVDLSFLD